MIDWEALRAAQIAYEIKYERPIQLSLLTAQETSGKLSERLSLDTRSGSEGACESFQPTRAGVKGSGSAGR